MIFFSFAFSWVFFLKTRPIRPRTGISTFSRKIITAVTKHRSSGQIQSPKLRVLIFESYRIWLLKFEPLPFMVTAIKELNTSEFSSLFWKAAVGCWNVSNFERVSDSSYWSISELRTKWLWQELSYWVYCLPSAHIKSAVKYFQDSLGNEILHLFTFRPECTSVDYIIVRPADSSVHVNNALTT